MSHKLAHLGVATEGTDTVPGLTRRGSVHLSKKGSPSPSDLNLIHLPVSQYIVRLCVIPCLSKNMFYVYIKVIIITAKISTLK